MYLRVFLLLLLSIYEFFFLLDCVIYACWGTPLKKFLELPLIASVIKLTLQHSRLRFRLDTAYFVENKKYCSKIIFKCVNGTVRLIFNEKMVKKEVCGLMNSAQNLLNSAILVQIWIVTQTQGRIISTQMHT